MMTRKHFVKIAEITKQSNIKGREDVLNKNVYLSLLLNFFEEENENFDRERFLKACGVTE